MIGLDGNRLCVGCVCVGFGVGHGANTHLVTGIWKGFSRNKIKDTNNVFISCIEPRKSKIVE